MRFSRAFSLSLSPPRRQAETMSTGKHGTGGESRETSARKGRKVEDERRRGGSRRQLGGRWLGEDEENEAERGGGGWLSSWLDIAQWRKQKPPKPLSVGVVLLSLSLSLWRRTKKSPRQPVKPWLRWDERPLSCPQNV